MDGGLVRLITRHDASFLFYRAPFNVGSLVHYISFFLLFLLFQIIFVTLSYALKYSRSEKSKFH